MISSKVLKISGLVVVVVIIAIASEIVIYTTLSNEDQIPGINQDEIIDSVVNPSEATNLTLAIGFHLVKRNRWGGLPIQAGDSRPLTHPVSLVIIGHTATSYCDTFLSCAPRLQNIQSYHVGTLNYIDIGYNFLVGGDGLVYEALGWDMQNYKRNNSIMISVIGNYMNDKVNDKIRDGVQALLKHGVELGKLDPNYKLVGHNQTSTTDSPGRNLVEEIKKWPHFSDEFIT